MLYEHHWLMRKREDVGGDGGSERVKVESAGDAVGVLRRVRAASVLAGQAVFARVTTRAGKSLSQIYASGIAHVSFDKLTFPVRVFASAN